MGKYLSLFDFVQEALKNAVYEPCEDGSGYVVELPDFPGCITQGRTIEEVRSEIQEIAVEWILLGIQLGDKMPVVNGYGLSVPRVTKRVRKKAIGKKELVSA